MISFGIKKYQESIIVMIVCEFDLCIYNGKNKCILNKIEIDAAGICGSCMLPDIPKKLVEKYKKELLDKLEKSYD